MEPKRKKKKKEKSKKRTKEKNKGEKDEVEVRTRTRSPNLGSKNLKMGRDDRELTDRTKKLEHSSEVHRDRKRYMDEPVYKDKTDVDSYRKREYKEKDKKIGMGEDCKYKDKIEERIRHHKDNEEKGRDRRETERKRYEGKSRR